MHRSLVKFIRKSIVIIFLVPISYWEISTCDNRNWEWGIYHAGHNQRPNWNINEKFRSKYQYLSMYI